MNELTHRNVGPVIKALPPKSWTLPKNDYNRADNSIGCFKILNITPIFFLLMAKYN